MPQIIFSSNAKNNLERLRRFIQSKNPQAAARAAQTIIKMIQVLMEHPQIGKPVEDTGGKMRELAVPFGRSGYVVRYVYEGGKVDILAVRHMKEAGFQMED